MSSISIIYPYRDRKLINLKNSFESLRNQTNPKFEAFLIDYGSKPGIAAEIEELCALYPYIKYRYYHTQLQPWNKSRALNSVIKELETEYCFVADVDMIFHHDFVKRAEQLRQKDTTVYFQVGFVGPNDKVNSDTFFDNKIRKSTSEATGLSMFPVKLLKELRGFDEFYHFWGAEDTDMHVRLQNAGYPVTFYDKEVLLLHQWHPSYRSNEKKTLTTDLQISGIVQLNHRHLERAKDQGQIIVNKRTWGVSIRETDLMELEKAPVNWEINNEQRNIDHLIFSCFPQATEGVIKIIIKSDKFRNSLEYKIKKLLGKKVPTYYNLKEINDKILLHLISFYRDNPYTFKVSDDLQQIEVAIKFRNNPLMETI